MFVCLYMWTVLQVCSHLLQIGGREINAVTIIIFFYCFTTLPGLQLRIGFDVWEVGGDAWVSLLLDGMEPGGWYR